MTEGKGNAICLLIYSLVSLSKWLELLFQLINIALECRPCYFLFLLHFCTIYSLFRAISFIGMALETLAGVISLASEEIMQSRVIWLLLISLLIEVMVFKNYLPLH